jgi:hypothetical protein
VRQISPSANAVGCWSAVRAAIQISLSPGFNRRNVTL